ncbi:sensor histidine kinase [Amycolatopsis regifaucium]|uniref:histidine kinase n=1 Tax=Amycolatopsis regifaucium TaxID=546365 RepID=A0A154MQ01_9PSEU|nr:sensor histidine kinase [Amycolatopsis regifaucium]KZB86382.1 histidine kinase [Amycolatopsis regifaucium]OKA06428.1 sensor histidine kinase [Amycolatopsis regifaucium]SFJ27678.1 Signal transduction histidine kinase [Amycolatopsis regifaucium]
MIRTYLTALGRGLTLAVLALVSWLDLLIELVGFCLLCVGLVFAYTLALEGTRPRAALTRRLSGRWCGIDVEPPYRPAPPEPERERDGWYRDGNSLFKRSWFIRWTKRFEWISDDPATGRDLGWQLWNPIAGLLLVPAVLLTGPLALRMYGHWTRWWLGPHVSRTGEGWLKRHLEALGHQMALFALSVAQLAMTVPTMLFLIGPTPLFPTMVLAGRTVTDTLRREARNWTGVRIDRPYLPEPPFPLPRPDGLYQYRRQLYDTPWWPARRTRLRWVMRDRATWRDLLAAVVNSVVLLLLAAPTAALVFFGFWGVLALWVWRPIAQWADISGSTTQWFSMVGLPEATTHVQALALTPVAVAAFVAGLVATPWLARQEARFAKLLLGPTEASRLEQRVERLKQTRTDASVAQAAEMRRIERDLHDGVQSRLVAMGMKLGAVEALIDTDPAAAKRLAAELRQTSSETLTELRLLVRGIHPPVLSERGLADAVRALALDSPLRASVSGSLPRLEQPAEACAYFVVSELLGNAAKHGEARRVSIEFGYDEGVLRIEVTDDGKGGANAARGSGIRGIERRLGAFDGTFALTSPPGGPTKATVEIPCQLDPDVSSPKTSTSSETA